MESLSTVKHTFVLHSTFSFKFQLLFPSVMVVVESIKLQKVRFVCSGVSLGNVRSGQPYCTRGKLGNWRVTDLSCVAALDPWLSDPGDGVQAQLWGASSCPHGLREVSLSMGKNVDPVQQDFNMFGNNFKTPSNAVSEEGRKGIGFPMMMTILVIIIIIRSLNGS